MWIFTGFNKTANLESKRIYLEKILDKNGINKEKWDSVIDSCNNADPTGDSAVYTQWILKQYLLHNFKGEEDKEKYMDTLSKFTKLKKSHRIVPADVNQYTSYSDLAKHVEDAVLKFGGSTSKGEEVRSKETAGVTKLGQDGEYKLYIVTTPEAASKLFRNTAWCVKDPKVFNEYADTSKNFYFFTKKDVPYMLVHQDDIRDVKNSIPTKKMLLPIANLMVKYNTPKKSTLLENNIINRSNEDIFWAEVKKAVEEGDAYGLLYRKIITRKDGDIFWEAVKKAIEGGKAYRLLSQKTITRKDGDIFLEAVKKEIDDGYSYDLLWEKLITRKDGDLFWKEVNKFVLDGRGNELVNDNIITEDELFKLENNENKEDANESNRSILNSETEHSHTGEAMKDNNKETVSAFLKDVLVAKASASDRHPAVVQGQEDLTGVKSVEINRSIKKNAEDEFVVTESVRTEMLYSTAEEATDAYNNIEAAKEEGSFDESSEEPEETSTEASYKFGMSVLANDITGFSGVSIESPKQPINVDVPVSSEQLDAYTKGNGYATEVIPSPGANSRVGKDPVTAEYTSLLEPNFEVSKTEHELKLGVDRELEHVDDPAKALEIAIDHLSEDKDYYTKLNKVMPEYGPEEKPERNVEISENPSDRELADKHDYEATYKNFVEDLLK